MSTSINISVALFGIILGIEIDCTVVAGYPKPNPDTAVPG
jgi:hypothetical protein